MMPSRREFSALNMALLWCKRVCQGSYIHLHARLIYNVKGWGKCGLLGD